MEAEWRHGTGTCKYAACVIAVRVPLITLQQYAKAESWQNSLTDKQWLARCDELAVEQRFAFLELLSFSRDGATHEQTVGLLSFLSVLQHLAHAVAPDGARPIEEVELAAGVKRGWHFFQATSSDDPAYEARLHQIWFESVQASGEPFLWAGCWIMIGQTKLVDSPLAQGMVLTLFGLVDCYSRRFSEVGQR